MNQNPSNMKKTAQTRIGEELKEAFRKVQEGVKDLEREDKYREIYGYYKGLLRAYDLVTEESKTIDTNFFEICAEAEKTSRKEGVVQHVNKAGEGLYIISDWKDSSTRMSFDENGNQLEV